MIIDIFTYSIKCHIITMADNFGGSSGMTLDPRTFLRMFGR